MTTACKECRYIVETKEKKCPRCGGELTEKFAGMIVILDPERSEVAKVIDINVKGKFAIRVK
ncbi:DNA-directed RNA polymerase subunit E'' [Candidatus Micrarchaeota archaeon]|nr:DNA-directed RNA polymerase subunit E'' [Candidatus Micrarchaeota archaeon]